MALLDELLGQQGQSVARGTPYQSGGVTPQLMQLIASMTGPRMTPTPTPLTPGGSPADAALQAHIAGMPQQTFEPEPVPDAPQLWRRILAGLGDAATVYGSGLGAPIPIGNASGMLADINNQRLETMRANRKGQMATDTANKRQKWEAELQRLIAGKEAEGKAAETKAAKEEAARLLKEQRTYKEEQDRIAHDRDVQLETMRQTGQTERETIQQAGMSARDRLNQRVNSGEPTAKDRMKDLKEAMAGVNEMAANLQEDLAAGVSPDQFVDTYRRNTAALRLLDPDAAAIVDAHFAAEIGDKLEARDQEEFLKGFEPQGPKQGFFQRLRGNLDRSRLPTPAGGRE